MKFEINKTYSMRFINNYDSILLWNVNKRTAKTITITSSNGETIKKRIEIDCDGNECVRPFGKYSMAPTIYSTNKL